MGRSRRDTPRHRASTFDSFKPIEQAIHEFVSPPSDVAAAPTAGPKAAADALGQLGLSLLAQLGLADAAIEPGASGLVLRIGVASKSGSDLEKALTAASLAPSALDMASQVGTGAMYGYAWSMDPAIVSGLSAQILAPLFSSLGLPADIAAKAAAMQAKWAKAAGPRGAINLDLDFDAAAIAGAKDFNSEDPAAIADLVKKMLTIKFDMMQDVKDEASYRALIKGLSSDPDYLALSKAYSDAFGLSIAVKNQDKKDGAFSYGELGSRSRSSTAPSSSRSAGIRHRPVSTSRIGGHRGGPRGPGQPRHCALDDIERPLRRHGRRFGPPSRLSPRARPPTRTWAPILASPPSRSLCRPRPS